MVKFIFQKFPAAYSLIVVACLLLCLAELGFAATPTPIVIGQSLNLGPSSYQIAKRWEAGANIYINWVNALGGINGRPIRLVTLNNDGNIKQHAQNIQMLVDEHKAVAIINCVGDKICVASAKMAAENHVPLIGSISGTRQLESAIANRQVFSIRPFYDKEAGAIAQQLRSMGISKVAVLGDTNDSERSKVLAESLPKAGITLDLVSITPTDRASLAAVGQRLMLRSNQAVVFDLEPSSIDTLSERGFFSHMDWPAMNISFANDGLTSLSTAFKGRPFAFTMVVPNPEAHSIPLVMEFQRNAERYGLAHAINFEGMESYINTRVCVEAIRRAGNNPNSERVTRVLQTMQNYDLGGYSVSFARAPKQESASNWLEIGLKASNGFYIR